jgi:hypothetical protein
MDQPRNLVPKICRQKIKTPKNQPLTYIFLAYVTKVVTNIKAIEK